MNEQPALTPRQRPLRRPTWMDRRGVAYWIGYAIREPRDFAYCAPRRVTCRLFSWHNATCQGRRGHSRR